MPAQDTSGIKEKILSILKRRGPSLPVHIAGETGLSILFSSAFLSELLSGKEVKISNMRVGSSPIYFIPGQEPLLERYSQHLKSKEKDAFTLLKERKFLKDIEQDPAIRVALRAIKDFAIPFKKNEEIFWRYLTIPESELKVKERKKQLITPQAPSREGGRVISRENLKNETSDVRSRVISQGQINETIKRVGGREAQKKSSDFNIFDESKKTIKKKTVKRTSQKKNDKFFNKVKEFLAKKEIKILDIENFSKSDLTLRVELKGQERLLIAYNKKRVVENDLAKAYKKAKELNLKYLVLSLGEPSKKLNSLIETIRTLEDIIEIE